MNHDLQALTTTESRDLARCEKIIERGQKTFLEVGIALSEIRDRKLYRERADTFQDYCSQVWGFTRQRAHQLIEAAKVETQLQECQPVVDANPVLPTERHARELARLPEEQRAGCLEDAKEKYGEGMTAAQLREEVDLWAADNEEPDLDGTADDAVDEPPPIKPTASHEPKFFDQLRQTIDDGAAKYGKPFMVEWLELQIQRLEG